MEEEVEKAVKEQAEVEDLSDVTLDLNEFQIEILYAEERLDLALTYQRTTIQAINVSASIKANGAVGNTKEVERLKGIQETLERDKKYCLRGIKEIDKACPNARELMINKQPQKNKPL